MEAIYGIEIRERDNMYHQVVERMGEIAEAIFLPGNFAVEAFPVLQYLPSWFPGAGFKTWARSAKQDIKYIADYLFDGAKAVVSCCVLSGRVTVFMLLNTIQRR